MPKLEKPVQLNESRIRVPPQRLWYVLWAAMLFFSVAKSFLTKPIFSGGLDFGLAMSLALVAGFQIAQASRALGHKEKALSTVLLILFCSAQFIQFALSTRPPSPLRGVDFSAYYIAAKVVSEKPAGSMYQLPLFPDGRMNLNAETPVSSPWHAAAVRYHVPFSAPYIYPPFLAILMKPIAHLSFASAYRAWNIMTMLLVLVAVFLSLDLGGMRLDGKLALMVCVGLFSYHPFLDNLFFGQISGTILFLIAAGVWLLARNYTSLSALSFAVATMIKLTPVLAMPILILHRRWKWLVAYLAWMAGLLIFSIWQAGWAAHQQFWHEVLPRISSGAPISQNLSIVAFIQELFLRHVPLAQNPPQTIPPYAGLVSRCVALVIYVLMLALVYVRRRDNDATRDLILITLLSIAISPISWPHHYLIAVLPFVYLWNKLSWPSTGVLGALLLAVGANFVAFFRSPGINPITQLVIALLVPGLTIALTYLGLSTAEERASCRTRFQERASATASSNYCATADMSSVDDG